MAITKILKISHNSRLSNSIDYIINPQKTDDGKLVSSYNCTPETAEYEFAITQLNAKISKGDYSKFKSGGNDIIAYHLIQSFDVQDNITAEQAHKIGKELASKFLDEKYEYVISTHIDKEHIHNHIIINSTSFYDNKKLRVQPYITVAQIRAISDRLCEEHKLNVIQNPSLNRQEYLEWLSKKQNINWKEDLTLKIQFCLSVSKSLNELKNNLKLLDVNMILYNNNNNIRKYPLFQNKDFKPVRGKNLIENLDINKIKSILSEPNKISSKNITEDFKKFIFEKSKIQIVLKGSEVKSISPKGVFIEIEKGKSIFIESKNVLINNSKITININKYLSYSIKNQSNNKISYKRITGSELLQMYDNNKNNYTEMSLSDKIKYFNRKNLLIETKDTARLLLIASRKNTTLDETLDILNKELSEFKQGTENLKSDINTYLKIKSNIQIINNNKSVYDEYLSENNSILFYRKNHKEIDEYLYAIGELQKNKIDINLDIGKLDALIERKKQLLLEQQKLYKEKENDLEKYKKITKDITRKGGDEKC